MIIGTGIDIVEVDRIKAKLDSEGFKRKVFSSSEIEYCEKMPDPFPHYAARFAAKEAFLKATGLGLTLTFELFEIEICSGENSQPLLILRGNVKDVAGKLGWTKLHVSLSHVKAMACATVIIES